VEGDAAHQPLLGGRKLEGLCIKYRR